MLGLCEGDEEDEEAGAELCGGEVLAEGSEAGVGDGDEEGDEDDGVGELLAVVSPADEAGEESQCTEAREGGEVVECVLGVGCGEGDAGNDGYQKQDGVEGGFDE